MKTAHEINVISHNLFAIKFYMSDDAPSIATLTPLTVIVICTQKNKPLFFVRYLCNKILGTTKRRLYYNAVN